MRQEFLEYAKHSNELFQLESEIKRHAKENKSTRNYCANYFWYRLYKPEVRYMVGWNARNPALKSEAAYDVVYKYLYDLLPDCRHEGMCC